MKALFKSLHPGLLAQLISLYTHVSQILVGQAVEGTALGFVAFSLGPALQQAAEDGKA